MRKMICEEIHFDAETQTCSEPKWQEDAGIFPPLSASEGAQIATAIVGVWVVGAAVRWAIQSMRDSQ